MSFLISPKYDNKFEELVGVFKYNLGSEALLKPMNKTVDEFNATAQAEKLKLEIWKIFHGNFLLH